MVASTLIMGYHHSIAIWLYKIQNQKSLMLLWRSFLGGSSNIVLGIFAPKGCQYCDCGWMPLHSAVIIQDAKPQIVDAPFTLISLMVQSQCHCPFNLKRHPLLSLWTYVPMDIFVSWRGRTQCHWCFMDSHPKDILSVIGSSEIALKMHPVIIDTWHIMSMDNRFHPTAARPLRFLATTINGI